ncbi:hypothetical protein ANAEL_04147 [Anaerolineales bacterium]|nr:hypothetical protein ANAEL_04147 [Anaerolineales bacterium]
MKPTPTNAPWIMGGLPLLNVASTFQPTRALGPGLRAVVWLQGCNLNCSGCIAPEWIPRVIKRLVEPEKLAEELLIDPLVTGLTFSGGEPMLQAAGLAQLARHARSQRNVSIICFTGLALEQLREHPPGPGVEELLAEVDVLIDGTYVASQNDNLGLRGSSNQRVLYLTERFRGLDLEHNPRRAEIHVGDGYAVLVGVPPVGLEEALDQAIASAKGSLSKG